LTGPDLEGRGIFALVGLKGEQDESNTLVETAPRLSIYSGFRNNMDIHRIKISFGSTLLCFSRGRQFDFRSIGSFSEIHLTLIPSSSS
jgi:hypothetical protein